MDALFRDIDSIKAKHDFPFLKKKITDECDREKKCDRYCTRTHLFIFRKNKKGERNCRKDEKTREVLKKKKK